MPSGRPTASGRGCATMSTGVGVLVGLGLLCLLGATLRALTRSLGTRSIVLRCPDTGLPTVVEGVTDPDGYLTGVVRCGAHGGAPGVPCGTRCVAGGAALGPERSPAELLDG